MDLINYVRVYNNVISDTFCDELIKKFEDNPQQYNHLDRANPDRNFKMSFNQINIMSNEGWEKETK